jgi:serine/threonine-protein kinase
MTQTADLTRETLAFLQRRVQWFGLVAGGLVLTFYSYRVVGSLSLAGLLQPHMLTHAGAGLSLLAMWAALRGPTRTARWVRMVETSGLVLASTLLVVMGTYLSVEAQPGRIVVLALAVVHLARAIYVPSSAQRTALISSVTGLVIVKMVFRDSLQVDLDLLKPFAPEVAALTPARSATFAALDAAAWWLMFGSLAVAASRVIYGLRKQVCSIRELGQYHIEAELGAGGMGIVYRARHALLRRETAVKLLPPARAGEAALQRFEREVKLTALPDALERLVLDCLEKRPELRPASARVFLKRLAQVEAGAWDGDQAEAWWREHGSMVRAASLAPTGTERTIQVDLLLGRSR